MGQRELARCLKVLDAVAVVCCLGVMLAIVPQRCQVLASANVGMTYLVACGWVFMALAAVPIVGIGVFAWRIFDEIGSDNSFSEANAARLVRIGALACAEAILFVLVTMVLAIIGALSDGLLAVLLVAVVASGGLGVIAFALSHLTAKAAAIKAENDLTV